MPEQATAPDELVAILMRRWGVDDIDQDAYDAACADLDVIPDGWAKVGGEWGKIDHEGAAAAEMWERRFHQEKDAYRSLLAENRDLRFLVPSEFLDRVDAAVSLFLHGNKSGLDGYQIEALERLLEDTKVLRSRLGRNIKGAEGD